MEIGTGISPWQTGGEWVKLGILVGHTRPCLTLLANA